MDGDLGSGAEEGGRTRDRNVKGSGVDAGLLSEDDQGPAYSCRKGVYQRN